MKKIYLAAIAVALLSSSALMAQDFVKDSTSAVDPKPSFKGFVSNKFWDNWEISIGGGVGTAMNGGNDPGPLNRRIGGFGEISVGKWLHPVVGLRGELQMGAYNNFTDDLTRMTWPYAYLHADLMINLSNWIGGYKEHRVYYAIPYVGMGYFASNFTDGTRSINSIPVTMGNFAVSYGLINKFRVSNSVDINLNLKGIVSMASVNPTFNANCGTYFNGLDASVGITYRFGKRDFERGAAGYTKEDVDALKAEAEMVAAQVKAEKEAKEDLSDDLAQAQKDAAAAQQRASEAEKQLADAQAELEALKKQQALDAATPEETIFFGYEVWGLDAVDMTALKELAGKMLAGPKDYVYTITGYADFSTGARSNNIAIAQKRAQSVYDYLVSLGVPAGQLTCQGAGPDAQPFTGRGNQSVTIK
jgi:outer membrane protein OmpA-like peptidoglycan-associated protein